MRWSSLTSAACAAVVGALFISLFPKPAEAIPAFARKYRTSCTTCHQGMFPKLNPFGKAFRQNGYRIPEVDETFVKEEPLALGARAWEQMWPRAVWPGEITSVPPLALRIRPEVRLRPTHDVAKLDFFNPQEIELLTGGTLGRRFSFWGEFALFENGAVGEVERTWLAWDNILGNPHLNMLIGQYELRAVPFSRFTKHTLADFITSAFTPGFPTVDGPRFNFSQRQRGIEVWGVADGFRSGGWEYAIGVVNGNGTPGRNALGTFDNNSDKDFYGRLAYKFGGAGVASGVPPAGTDLRLTDNWVDDSIRLGIFGYRGIAPFRRGGVLRRDANLFTRAGFDLEVFFRNLHFFGAWMAARDTVRGNFPGAPFDRARSATAWFLEADYLFFPWLTGVLRYETTNTPDDVTERNRKRVIPSVSIGLRPNIRLIVEGEIEVRDHRANFFRSRLDFAF